MNQNPNPNPNTPYASSTPATPYASPAQLGVKPDARLQAAFLSHAFLWMFAGLLVTAGVAYLVQSNERILEFAYDSFFILFLIQIGIVMAISAAINRISASAALGLFFVYAATLGITIGAIVFAYTSASVATAFVSAAAMFGAAAIYGATTKRSLDRIGGILFMGVIGILVASVLNIFLHNDGLSWVISIVGVVLFTGLTAFHIQKIQDGALAAATGSMEKGAVIGALLLYLDFINLFLFFLRLTGSQR
jgi:FtsH-binding integral membrane protein